MFSQSIWKCFGFPIAMMIFTANSFSQTSYSPIELHKKYNQTSLPVAIYKNIKREDFKKLIIAAFETSNFSFVSTTETPDQNTLYKFSYANSLDAKSPGISLFVRTNETIDGQKRCANCFLRLPNLIDDPTLKNLPWMTQYEISSGFYPAIDKAYSTIQNNGQQYMDQKFGFDYRKQWDGERNFEKYGNSFIGISLSDLKRDVVQTYTEAGFLLVQDRNMDASTSDLIFSFPIEIDGKEGVGYRVRFFNQLDGNGFCNPCEVAEIYDPHQKLPAAGISGMSSRLTLESRFITGRTRAFEQLKNTTTRYLRPRTSFTIPPKPAPLGSPRVLAPMVVT